MIQGWNIEYYGLLIPFVQASGIAMIFYTSKHMHNMEGRGIHYYSFTYRKIIYWSERTFSFMQIRSRTEEEGFCFQASNHFSKAIQNHSAVLHFHTENGWHNQGSIYSMVYDQCVLKSGCYISMCSATHRINYPSYFLNPLFTFTSCFTC